MHPALRLFCKARGASQATMHRQYATVSLIAACVQGLTLPGDYASAASKLAGPVRTVSSVGCGDIEGVEEGTIVVEGTTATMVAADAVVYSAGDGADANFAGLLEAVEVDLALRASSGGARPPKVVVVVARNTKAAKKALDKMWAAAAKPPSMADVDRDAVLKATVVEDASAVAAALQAAGSTEGGAAAVAQLKAAQAFASKHASVDVEADAAEVSAAPSVVAAASKAIEEDLPRLAAALEARVQLASTFCETLGAECEGVVGDVLEAFDAAAGEGGALLKATRDSVARDARRALERTVLPAQLELLRAKAFGELKKKLKGLRIQRGVRQDAQKMVSQSVAFFDQKAKAALAKTAWSARAQKRDLEMFLSDYVQERLDAAVLGGTHIPGGRQGLRKLWPFPVALSFHWLQPAALGRAVDGAQGLTASDLKRFNVKAEDVGKPAFAIPDRLKNLGAGLRSSNAAPVE